MNTNDATGIVWNSDSTTDQAIYYRLLNDQKKLGAYDKQTTVNDTRLLNLVRGIDSFPSKIIRRNTFKFHCTRITADSM